MRPMRWAKASHRWVGHAAPHLARRTLHITTPSTNLASVKRVWLRWSNSAHRRGGAEAQTDPTDCSTVAARLDSQALRAGDFIDTTDMDDVISQRVRCKLSSVVSKCIRSSDFVTEWVTNFKPPAYNVKARTARLRPVSTAAVPALPPSGHVPHHMSYASPYSCGVSERRGCLCTWAWRAWASARWGLWLCRRARGSRASARLRRATRDRTSQSTKTSRCVRRSSCIMQHATDNARRTTCEKIFRNVRRTTCNRR